MTQLMRMFIPIFMLIMFDRIFPLQFRLIYKEITGNYSAPDTKQQVQFDLRMQTIMGSLD